MSMTAPTHNDVTDKTMSVLKVSTYVITSIKASPCDTNDNVCHDFQNWPYSIFKTFSVEVETDDWSRKER